MPYLSQRAREVEPIYTSFSSTGLYVLFTQSKVYFWLGNEFHRRYFWDGDGIKKGKKLISDGLFIRLLTIYRQDVLFEDPAEVDFVRIFEKSLSKAEFVTEGDETKAFMRIINGKEETT